MVLDTTGRTAGLDRFAGHALAGDWTLFVADLSGGNPHRLDRWAVTFDLGLTPLPESGTVAAAAFLALLGAGWWIRGQGKR
jgi:hypothetical protein